jgi:very-short-patch-repair endonuclease
VTIRENARAMRRAPTKSEIRLWAWLRNRKFNGFKFRRQYSVAGYILDFYCVELKLAIEADGKHHSRPDVFAYDDGRTCILNALGIEILRIPNEVLAFDPQLAVEMISIAIEARSRHSSSALRAPSPR